MLVLVDQMIGPKILQDKTTHAKRSHPVPYSLTHQDKIKAKYDSNVWGVMRILDKAIVMTIYSHN